MLTNAAVDIVKPGGDCIDKNYTCTVEEDYRFRRDCFLAFSAKRAA